MWPRLEGDLGLRAPSAWTIPRSSMTSFCRREMMLWYCDTWYSTLFVFFVTLVLMFLARFAYFNVLCVSSKLD